jgi:micrococcal nuclease
MLAFALQAPSAVLGWARVSLIAWCSLDDGPKQYLRRCLVACRAAMVAGLIAGNAFSARAADAAAAPESCNLEAGDIRTVARIVDGETLSLDDGSEVRLIGALAPRASDAGAQHGAWPDEQAAIQALTTLTLGHTVKLAYGGRHRDRYGRHLAHLFVIDAAQEKWVQGEMLSAGVARSYGLPGSFVCTTELRANERAAKIARLGIWNTAFYHAKPAQLTALLLSRRSQFEIVEGTVSAVSRTKSGVYLNFGADAKTDFTVRIGKDVLAANAAWDRSLSELTGKTVSVRGWIERRNGPMIDIRDPSQLEIQDAADPAPTPPPVAIAPAETPAPDTAGAKSDDAAKQKRPANMTSPGAVNL